MVCIKLDIKFDWLGLAYGLVYPILVVSCGRVGYEKIVVVELPCSAQLLQF